MQEHAIALSGDGWVHEVYYKGGGQPIGTDEICTISCKSHCSCWLLFTRDKYQHVIVATPDGQIHEHYFAGGGGASGSDVIANIAG